MMDNFVCPICQTELQRADENNKKIGDTNYFSCLRCGKYCISRSLLLELPLLLNREDKSALLSHSIRKMQREKEIPSLDTYKVEAILQKDLPTLSEQTNSLISWLGVSTVPGHKSFQTAEFIQALIGARTTQGAVFVIRYLKRMGLLEEADGDDIAFCLTMEGWEYYTKLLRGSVDSHKAFMAMKFGDKDLDQMLDVCFKPAVKATGFELYRLDEQPRAGLIDDRLRVEIRNSRFLLSDLTHENAGAYWEAGFAEGLGKPVIYTCEKSKFETQKTHFDTNHHLTILWNKERPEEAFEQLKATIRATLPDEAKLID